MLTATTQILTVTTRILTATTRILTVTTQMLTATTRILIATTQMLIATTHITEMKETIRQATITILRRLTMKKITRHRTRQVVLLITKPTTIRPAGPAEKTMKVTLPIIRLATRVAIPRIVLQTMRAVLTKVPLKTKAILVIIPLIMKAMKRPIQKIQRKKAIIQ